MCTDIFIFTSQHTGHIKRNLAKRQVRIVSNPDTLSYRLEELKEFLLNLNIWINQ